MSTLSRTMQWFFCRPEGGGSPGDRPRVPWCHTGEALEARISGVPSFLPPLLRSRGQIGDVFLAVSTFPLSLDCVPKYRHHHVILSPTQCSVRGPVCLKFN